MNLLALWCVCVCVCALTGMCTQSSVNQGQKLVPGPEPLDTDPWQECLNASNVSGVTASGCPVHSYQPSSNGSKTEWNQGEGKSNEAFHPKKSTASCFTFSKPSKHLWIGRITYEAPFPAAIQCHSFSKYIWADYYVLVRWPGHIIILSFLKKKKKKLMGKTASELPHHLYILVGLAVWKLSFVQNLSYFNVIYLCCYLLTVKLAYMYESNFHSHCPSVCLLGTRKQQSLIFIIKSAEEGKEMSKYFLASYCGFPGWLSGKDPPAMQEM